MSGNFEGLLHYFDALRAESGQTLPSKQSFQPFRVPELANWMTILDLRTEGEIRTRYCGNSIVEFFGVDTTGDDVLKYYVPEIRSQVIGFFHTLLNHPCAGRVSREAQVKDHIQFRLEMSYFPFLAQDGTASFIIGVAEVPTVTSRVADISLKAGKTFQILTQSYVDIGYGIPDKDEHAWHGNFYAGGQS